MTILWERGPATVEQIQVELDELEEPEIARQTIQTYLRALRRYGWVRAEPVGGHFRYSPTLAIALVRSATLDYITDRLYGGCRDALIVDLLKSPKTRAAALARARRALERRLADPAPPAAPAAPAAPAGPTRGPGAGRPPSAAPAGSRATPGRPSGTAAGSSPGNPSPSP